MSGCLGWEGWLPMAVALVGRGTEQAELTSTWQAARGGQARETCQTRRSPGNCRSSGASVEFHLTSIYRKLGVTGRPALRRLLREHE
jgi:hypothetical protein